MDIRGDAELLEKVSTLRRSLGRLSRVYSFMGLNLRRLVLNIVGIPGYFRDMILYSRQGPSSTFRIRLRDCYPILDERGQAAGILDGVYFHQDLWAARKIFQHKPEKHIDIGSRMDGFIAHLLTFMSVTVIDIRPVESKISGLTMVQDDATQLKGFADHSVDSISSLHVAEHFGLGRYSDPVDPNAYLKFIKSLQRVLRPGGRLYFSVPIGRERVEFNAHRVFATSTIINSFEELSLVSFSFVDDLGRLHEYLDPECCQNAEYGCGLFEFTRTPPLA